MNENKLSEKVDFLLDVINLLEVNGFLPPKLIERSRNRMKINELKEKIEKDYDQKLQDRLNQCMGKELKYQKVFKKLNGKKFLSRFLDKISV